MARGRLELGSTPRGQLNEPNVSRVHEPSTQHCDLSINFAWADIKGGLFRYRPFRNTIRDRNNFQFWSVTAEPVQGLF